MEKFEETSQTPFESPKSNGVQSPFLLTVDMAGSGGRNAKNTVGCHLS